MCAHFCYKMVHCEMFIWCIVGFVQWVYSNINDTTEVRTQKPGLICFFLPNDESFDSCIYASLTRDVYINMQSYFLVALPWVSTVHVYWPGVSTLGSFQYKDAVLPLKTNWTYKDKTVLFHKLWPSYFIIAILFLEKMVYVMEQAPGHVYTKQYWLS